MPAFFHGALGDELLPFRVAVRVVIAFLWGLLVSYILILARLRTWRMFQPAALRSVTEAAFIRIRAAFASASTDPFTRKISALIAKRRVQRMRNAVTVITHGSAVAIVWSLYGYHYYDAWNTGEVPLLKDMLFGWEPPMLVVTSCIVFYFTAFPKNVTRRSIDAAHVLVSVAIMLRLIFYPNYATLVYENSFNVMTRLIMGLAFGNIRLTAVLNTIIFVVEVTSFANLSFPYQHRSPYRYCKFPVTSTEAYVSSELTSLIVIIMSSKLIEAWMLAEAEATLKGESSCQVEATVRNLLSSTCDAVVRLGPDLSLSEPCPKLCGLLIRHAGTEALRGTPFLDLVSETDRDRLVQCLCEQPDPGIGPAQTFHISLRDSNGTLVPVQIFHNRFVDIYDHLCYMVGIQEVGDFRVGVRFSQGSVNAHACLNVAPTLFTNPECLSVTSESSTTTLLQDFTGEDGAILAEIEVFSPDYSIRSCSSTFAALCGPSATGLGFLLWLHGNDERQSFRAWVQDCFNNATCGDPVDNGPRSMLLCPPGMQSAARPLAFECECELLIPDGNVDDIDTLTLGLRIIKAIKQTSKNHPKIFRAVATPTPVAVGVSQETPL